MTHLAYAYILLLVVFHTLKGTVSECSEHAWAIMPIKAGKQNISSIGLGLLAELMLFSKVFAAADLLLNCIQAYMTICHGFCLYTTGNLTKNRVAVHFLFFRSALDLPIK